MLDGEAAMQLEEFFAEHNKCALAFSGGTDSAYLLYAALQYGCDVRAYYMSSQFQPEFEDQDATRMAEQLGTRLYRVKCDILKEEQIRCNPVDRCYYCKQSLMSAIRQQAKNDGYSCVIDGTNASDKQGDRPGMRALLELGILSPLRMCGITKTEVRRLSKEAGLFTYRKPSYACLATRIAQGHEILEEDLKKVERAEDLLSEMGFRNFRIRLYRYAAGAAALETEESQREFAQENLDRIRTVLRPWFQRVVLEEKCREAEEIPQ